MKRKKTIAVTAAITSLFSGTAFAAPAALLDNTLQVVTYDGKSGTVTMNKDGSYVLTVDGATSPGKWWDKDGNVCFALDSDKKERCAAVAADISVGGSFTTDIGDTATVVAGR